MSMNILNDISAVYMDQIAESAVPGKPAERLGAVTAIPKSEKEAAAKRIRDKTKAKREAMKTESLDPVGQEDDDIDNDGDTDKSDKYLLNRRKVRSKAISKRKVEEGFSNWRQDLSEVMGRDEKNTKIKEKKEINNKVKTSAMGGGIKIDEAVEEIGGTLIEMVEIDEVDYIVESVYDELLGEGTLQEKALSKQQQKFMGMVYAVKKGDMAAPSPEVAKAASGMTKQQAKDFAKTKHKGLPQVKEDILNERENDEPGEGPRQKYGDMRGIDRSGPPTSFGGKWQSKERKSAGASALAKRPKKVEESVDEIPMTPQELNLQKKKSAIDIMIAKRRQQSILKNKNQ